MDAFHKHHTAQPLHDGDGEPKVLVQQQVDRAAAPEDELQRHRPHKGRHDEWQHPQCLDDERAPELEAHRQVGQRHGNQRRKHHRCQRHPQAVEKRLTEQVLRQKVAKVSQRERTGVGHESGVHHQPHRHQ